MNVKTGNMSCGSAVFMGGGIWCWNMSWCVRALTIGINIHGRCCISSSHLTKQPASTCCPAGSSSAQLWGVNNGSSHLYDIK